MRLVIIMRVVPGVGGTSISGLDRYVLPNRVWFLRDPILKIRYHLCLCWQCIPGVILR